MNEYSDKELLILARLDRRDQVKLLERRRRRLLAIIGVGGLLAIALIGVMLLGYHSSSLCGAIIGIGLMMGIAGLSIELADYQILTAKLFRQLSREAVKEVLNNL